MSSVNSRLAQKLREARGNKTLYQLSSESGIPRSMLFRYEKGQVPTDDILEKLSLALGLEMYELKKLHFEDSFPEGSSVRSLLIRWVKELIRR